MDFDLTHPPLCFLSVNYNSTELLKKLLCSLGPNPGIVIVNNFPEDEEVHRLAGSFYGGGEAVVLCATENAGFGVGCNIGLGGLCAIAARSCPANQSRCTASTDGYMLYSPNLERSA